MGDELNGRFGWLDWSIVLALLALTTWIGHRKSGKQHSMRDFFLGGRKLPWYAVAASIVATEISAVTLVSLPSVVWRPGGDLTYLQIGLIGSLLAKAFIGFVLVPAYFEREIYSPYDYMGRRLGGRVRATATVLFSLGGVLGQAARVYLTAGVLEVVLSRELAWIELHTGLSPLVASVSVIGIVAVLWTLMGGIATVVWTDAILFLMFLAGIAIGLGVALAGVDGGIATVVDSARSAGKLRLFDTSTDPTRAYTLWTALIASTWGMVGSYGTDQLIAQRLFCCRDARAARRAILASYSAVIVIALVACTGLALHAYTAQHPFTGAAAAIVAEKPDRLLPVFLIERVPVGLKGLVVAGIFAAAISSVDSILAALAQTTLSGIGALRERLGSGARAVRASRVLIGIYAVLLCAAAIGTDVVARSYASILDLALAMASYTGGALIAGFFLAFLRLSIDGSGFAWGALSSVLTVLALTSHQGWSAYLPAEPETLALVAALALFAAWIAMRVLPDARRGVAPARLAVQSAGWAAGLALVVWITHAGYFERQGADGELAIAVLAWPWYLPIGSAVAFTFGWLLARPRAEESA